MDTTEFEYLSVDDVLAIHADQVERYGGSPVLRDRGMLESAVAMPIATFQGVRLHTDIFEIAAAYLFHLVQNHPFMDGNKRTGTAAALVFLELNSVRVEVSDDRLVELVLRVAQGQCSKPEVTSFLREHSVRNDITRDV